RRTVSASRLGAFPRGAMPPQSITVSAGPVDAVVALEGEHEAYTADKLAKCLGGLIAEAVSVSVDLRRATFIDSTIMGVLIAQHRRATELGLSFNLLVGPETGWPVRRMLEVTGMAAQLGVVAG